MADYPIRTREQAFLAAIAGEGEMPTPKNRKEAILAKAGGADVDIEPKSGNEYWTLAAMQGGGGATLELVADSKTAWTAGTPWTWEEGAAEAVANMYPNDTKNHPFAVSGIFSIGNNNIEGTFYGNAVVNMGIMSLNFSAPIPNAIMCAEIITPLNVSAPTIIVKTIYSISNSGAASIKDEVIINRLAIYKLA